MRYTVFGAGAIGGTVGAHMARGGEDVLFVDRDAHHVRRMRERGLTIRGFAGTFTVPAQALTPDELPGALNGPLETVLLAVKAPATEEAVSSFAGMLAPDGCVVSLQNGLNELVIARLVGERRTVGAFINFSADYLEPGLIHFGGPGAFYVGELDGSITPRLEALRRALGYWGNVQITDNIWGYLWGKQAYGSMLFATALGNESMADGIDRHRPLMIALAREVLDVASALGIRAVGFDGFEPEAVCSSDPAIVHASLDRLVSRRRQDQKTHSGVWRDLAVRKRRTEANAIFGPVFAEAQRLGVATPLLVRMVEMIHQVEEGRRALATDNIIELALPLADPNRHRSG
jgi:2-dehydropantoate 2-reductase